MRRISVSSARFAPAESLLAASHARARLIGSRDDVLVGVLLRALADLRRREGRFPEAESLLAESHAALETAAVPDSRENARALLDLGMLLDEEGRKDEGVPALRRCLEESARAGLDQERLGAVARVHLACCLTGPAGTEQAGEAVRLWEQGKKILLARPSSIPVDLEGRTFSHAIAFLEGSGRSSEAAGVRAMLAAESP
ncbi:MAG: tetratricopeptide repeat protein [Candidatus Eisenbacteria bacterium]